MGRSQFAVNLFVCFQTICRPSSNKVETPGGTKYQIQIPYTEYQIHAPKHQTHARPKTFFCCRFIGALQTSKGKGHLDDRLGRKKDKTDHYSLLMRPGSSFYVMLVGFMSSSPSLKIYPKVCTCWMCFFCSRCTHHNMLCFVLFVFMWMCSPAYTSSEY